MNDRSEQLKIGDFGRFRLDGWTVRLNPRFPRALAEAALLRRSDAAPGTWRTITSSDYTHVHHGELSVEGQAFCVFAKEFLYRNAGDIVKHLIRPSRARRSVQAALMLRRLGFNCPEIVALAQRRIGPVCLRSIVVTTAIQDSEPIYDWLQNTRLAADAQTLRRRRDLLRQVGREIGRLHAGGICHGDLRPRNILVQRDGDRWRFFLLDNERTQRCLHLSAALRVKNLVQINMFPEGLSRTDRMRFWQAYLVENPPIQADRFRWAERIMHRTTQRIERKYGPLGRPL